MSEINVGSVVPNFSVLSTGNKTFELYKNKGKKIVIYFYPRDNTPGCTTEGLEFNEALPEFSKANAVVVGVSMDSLKKHENFKAKQAFNFELLADIEGKVCNIFNVYKLKKLYGKEYMGIERSTFILDDNAVVTHCWRKVRVKGHVDEVLKAVMAGK